VVPELSARLRSGAIFGRTKVVLAPFAACTVLPLFLARELGLSHTELGTPMTDPMLPHLTLWLWRESHPIEIYGEALGEHLLTYLPIAFDSSEKLDSVVLGQHFFHRVRLVLDRKGKSSIERHG
jgi:hypothetical protein